MHASYVTKILPCTKFENQVVTKAEEFLRFQLGFEFLNTQKSSSVKESQNKARFSELTEAERNRLLRVETQTKSMNSSTNWAVNVFKGMEIWVATRCTKSLQSYKSASSKNQRKMSLLLSRFACSGSGNDPISSVHNHDLQVAARSTTEIDTSTKNYSLIDQSDDPLLSSTAPVFAGANKGSISGCTLSTKYFMVM